MANYICVIKKDIPDDFVGIRGIQNYAGKTVHLKGDGGSYEGMLPKSNNHRIWNWNNNCFSKVEKIN